VKNDRQLAGPHGTTFAAVEAPRVWTEGNALEVELAVPQSVRAQLAAMGHKVVAVPTVAGVIRQKFQTSALSMPEAPAPYGQRPVLIPIGHCSNLHG
jgi:hypothetical protein